MFVTANFYNLLKGLGAHHSKFMKCVKNFQTPPLSSRFHVVSRSIQLSAKLNQQVNVSQEREFKLRRALLVSKLTRFEFEKCRCPQLSDQELETRIRDRGTDYDALLYYHNLHKKFEQKVAKGFQECGVDIQLVNRTTINKEKIRWADMLVPIGGDGTFLLAAGRASLFFSEGKHRVPVVGFNSDPNRSEGRLMIPHQYSVDVKGAIRRILKGDFKWMDRSRIRITLLGSNKNFSRPVDLHENTSMPIRNCHPEAEYLSERDKIKYQSTVKRVLPYLALNEVFIGETLSARVSHLQLQVDESEIAVKTKCSGLCVSTGTGSTSWLTSINRLTTENVDDLIRILHEEKKIVAHVDPRAVADRYNRQLLFSPNDPRLCYSIREEIYVGVWPNPKILNNRDFAKSLFVKSRCIDASLVIDGSISYPFNDGNKALLEVRPEDSLKTIAMDN